MICTNNYNDVRTTTLLEAINLCDGEKNLSLAIKINQTTIDAWLKDPSIIIDHSIALKIEQATGVTIERLMPCNNNTNHNNKKIDFICYGKFLKTLSSPLTQFLYHSHNQIDL